LLIGSVVLVLLGLIIPFGGRVYFRETGLRDLGAETTRLDAEDPGWRFDDLMAARERAAPPEAENSAVVVRKVRTLLPDDWRQWVRAQPTADPDGVPPALNRRQLLDLRFGDTDLVEATRPARELALTLRNYRRGYHVVVLGDAPFIESLDETQGAREVARLLTTEAQIAAQSDDPVRGLRAARAILATGRSIGDEPSIISVLVRYTCERIAAETAVRVLALTDSRDALPELAALQAELLAEAEEPVLVNAFRGERAVMSHFFDGLVDGRIGADTLAKWAELRPSAAHRTTFYFRRAFIPEDQRRFLRLMTELVETAKGPPHTWIARSEAVEAELRANWDMRYPFHRLMLPASATVMATSVRNRAEVLAAATLLACERFRLTRGRWPESLSELPKELLATVPVDPYTGEPIKLAKTPQGIAVYSAAPKSARGLDMKRLTNPLGGSEVGWQLYDPQHRNLPPLPPPKPEGADGPP
jgi:hypothetical protein